MSIPMSPTVPPPSRGPTGRSTRRDWGQGEYNGMVEIWAQRTNSGPQSVGKTAYKMNG
jgi:hypothetical protein